jgi:hypothetical protein
MAEVAFPTNYFACFKDAVSITSPLELMKFRGVVQGTMPTRSYRLVLTV